MYTFEGLHRPVRNPTAWTHVGTHVAWYVQTSAVVAYQYTTCQGILTNHTLPLTLGPVIPPDPTVVCMIAVTQ